MENTRKFGKIPHARLGRRAYAGTFIGALALLASIAPPAMGVTERFVVIGGGVCGVTCCQVLSASLVHPGAAPMDAKVADPQPPILIPQPSTLNPQPSTLNPDPSTLNPQP